MILGLSSALSHDTPAQWAKKHREIGCSAVVFPVNCEEAESVINAYCKAAAKENLTIAEVGIWKNVLSADLAERKKAIAYAIGQLKLADKIGAACCVNIAGTPHGKKWDGGYAGNFSQETYELTVTTIQHIIDEAAPKHTKFTIESMPWMIPSSPDEYLQLIQDVNRSSFGVHLDFINMVNCPKRYFFAKEFLQECFTKLHGKICSCHLKDVKLLEEYTFQLRECACGEGTLPLEVYADLATKENSRMPMIIEHLPSDKAYLQSLQYVKSRLASFIAQD